MRGKGDSSKWTQERGHRPKLFAVSQAGIGQHRCDQAGMGRAVGQQQRQLVLMKARVGLYDDGWGLDQFDGVDRIVSAADPELEDGKEIAFVAVVGLVAAPESWPVLGSLCRRPHGLAAS